MNFSFLFFFFYRCFSVILVDNLFPVQPNLNVEPNGGGGAGSHWKSNLNALHVPPESKPPDDFQCSQPQTQQQATPTSKSKLIALIT